MKLAVVIPAMNEKTFLPELVARVDAAARPRGAQGDEVERLLVLVDDGSTDGTTELIRELERRDDVVASYHPRNQGKGAALRTGFKAALEHGADVLLIQDADLEYDPKDHEGVLAPILSGRADAVIGSRFLGQTHRVLYYWHFLANRFITCCSNVFTNLNLSDIECCYKAFSRDVASGLDLEERSFGVEPEIVAKLAKMHVRSDDGRTRPLRVYEVPVSYAGRTYAEGKKIRWTDGFEALWCIVKYNVLR